MGSNFKTISKNSLFYAKSFKGAGFSLIETIIAISLLVIVFLGVFGLIQLGIRLTAQSKARITATALANQKIELARNLPYVDIGTEGGIPSGSILETEAVVRNRITYTVKTTVVYVDDPFDNLFPADPLAWDYKRIKVNVSWSSRLGGQVFLQTDIAPKGVETTGGGGIISILVFDANGQPVSQADIHIENNVLFPPIDATYDTNDQGRLFIPGAPACNDCYKITATKAEYSSERTYAVGEQVRGIILSQPTKPFISVIENELSEISFAIDRLRTKNVQTIKYAEEKTWNDSFDDQSKISDISQLVVDTASGTVKLEEQGGQYLSSGYILSIPITPTALVEWGRLNFTDDTLPSTDVIYQLLYQYEGNWILIPDEDLTVEGVDNSTGFGNSPLDLSQLDTLKYSSIKIKASFSTADSLQTSALFDWHITWFSSDTSTPVPNIAFVMQGAKSLGLDSAGQPVYKYQENLNTNSNGQLTISNLEWNSYKIIVNGPTTGYDIANSYPAQPVDINPSSDQTTILKLAFHQSHTFLVTVKDAAGLPLVGASIRLYKIGYDKTKLASDSGQAFFGSLVLSIYNLEVKIAGYSDWLSQIDVSGQTEQIVVLTPP